MRDFARFTAGFLQDVGDNAEPASTASSTLRVVSEYCPVHGERLGDSRRLQGRKSHRGDPHFAVQKYRVLQVWLLRFSLQQVRGHALAFVEGHRRRKIERSGGI